MSDVVDGSDSRAVEAGAAGLPSGSAWGRLLTTAPGVGAALLPKVACPACWPAYAGLLSALGLGFLMQTRYLLPLTVAFLALALGAIGWRARSRRGFGPVLLGLAASTTLLVGKFALESDAATWTGVGTLVAASAWNAWPRRASLVTSDGCSACTPRADAASHPRGE